MDRAAHAGARCLRQGGHKRCLSYPRIMLRSPPPGLIALALGSVAELGSQGQAASRSQMPQPAVSMRMSQLERTLGGCLLQRGPPGNRLTPACERAGLSRQVLSEARAMMAAVQALVAGRTPICGWPHR